MRDIAIISLGQTDHTPPHRRQRGRDADAGAGLLEGGGITKDRVDFVCSGSSDYLAGQAFSFVTTLDGFGPWPPISGVARRHGRAWALYEAWVKMQTGHADISLIYAYSKSSPGEIRRVMSRQMDPYYTQPLWADPVSLAIQARTGLDAGTFTEEQMAEVVAASRRNAKANPRPAVGRCRGQGSSTRTTSCRRCTSIARRSPMAPPRSSSPPATSPASSATGRRGSEASITASSPTPSACATTTSVSTKQAAEKAAWRTARSTWPSCTRRSATRRSSCASPWGWVTTCRSTRRQRLAANPIMTAGLIRLGEAAARISAGEADRAIGHATSGVCLQQNLVCVLEGE